MWWMGWSQIWEKVCQPSVLSLLDRDYNLLLNGSSRNLHLDLVGSSPSRSSVGGHIAFALDG